MCWTQDAFAFQTVTKRVSTRKNSAVHPKAAKEVTAGAWTSTDSLCPATMERRKSTAITWRQSEGEGEAEWWKQGDKEGYLPWRTTWIQIQKCCPKADLPLVCWGMDSRDQQLTLHFRRTGRMRGGDRESVKSSVFLDCILRGKCEHSQKNEQILVTAR